MTGEGRRTQALRSPVGGGFTPATSAAASNPCLNCGTNIQLTYCPECGQREIETDPALKDFMREIGDDVLRREGKMARTFNMLLSRPGELTREFADGRRVRYVSPPRVYLGSVLVFVAVYAIVARSIPSARGIGLSGLGMFVLMPAFAAGVAFAYRFRRRHYPQHLVFTMHVYSVWFLALSAATVAALIPMAPVRLGINVVLALAGLGYLVAAARRAYAR